MELCTCGKPAKFDKLSGFYVLCDECQAKLRVDTLDHTKELIGIPKTYKGFSFNDFDKKQVDKIKKMSDNFKINFVLSGESYVGKTAFMCAVIDYICKECTKPLKISFMNCPKLITNPEAFRDSTYNSDLLVLDDFVEPSREVYWSIYNLLNYRAENNLLTYTTTNLSDIKDSRIKSRLLRDGGLWLDVTSLRG